MGLEGTQGEDSAARTEEQPSSRPYANSLHSPGKKSALRMLRSTCDEECIRCCICYSLRSSFMVSYLISSISPSTVLSSTSQILGNNECIEPYTSNMYVRRVRAGEFIVVNPHLLADLVAQGLWTKEVRRSQIMS